MLIGALFSILCICPTSQAELATLHAKSIVGIKGSLKLFLDQTLKDNNRGKLVLSEDGLGALASHGHRFVVKTGEDVAKPEDEWYVDLSAKPFRAIYLTRAQPADPALKALLRTIRRESAEASHGDIMASRNVNNLIFASMLTFKYGYGGTNGHMIPDHNRFISLGEINFLRRGANPNRSAIRLSDYPKKEAAIDLRMTRFGPDGKVYLSGCTFETGRGEFLGARPMAFVVNKDNTIDYYRRREWQALGRRKSVWFPDPLTGMTFEFSSYDESRLSPGARPPKQLFRVRQNYGEKMVSIATLPRYQLVTTLFTGRRMFVQGLDTKQPEFVKDPDSKGGFPSGTDLFEVDIEERRLKRLGEIQVRATSSSGRYWIVTTLTDGNHWFLDMGA